MNNSNEKSKECCDECFGCINKICINSHCPCHKPSVEVNKEKKLVCMKAHCRCMNIGKTCGNHHYEDSCFEPNSIPLDNEEDPLKWCSNCKYMICKCGNPDIVSTPNLAPESAEMGEWSERFDSFYFIESDGEWNKEMGTPSPEKIKQFIKNLLSTHSQKLVSELKRKIKEMPIYHTLKIEDEEYQLISKVDVINIINNS